ncbi:hypothetical protein E6P09_07775 [Haloferax mediterranei ATCC 33500]|uniref:Uncharacterized protein n=1 Tax=Haloferax mediterranei (strain ATCC 33500 / DSM 1411 / JCM 8866 / NBRC 14739 / NCIMB 2177 / R-4) TaxID=523841 RepID=M0J2Y0_HALMT|nr:hypothetical protein [Haloferax mediterranei]AHZ21966.1 hypothetical protein BM92_04495 [Haloferax mediterranei ATCC 33500]EMA03477.1 hypothetical protein C439_05745 [Haloferax mediterranei ATCC 33500]MDX5988759.1 hypothetical protein [Haloferax mediterranei ATCC 33500]QCQ76619.1 hypothetical protein E6P09_07775 [Haloferax mediterranei ATCC 33500]
MTSLDLMKAGIGLAVVIGIALTVVAGYALFTTLGGISGMTVAPELFVSILFGGLLVASAAAVRQIAPKPRTRV